MNNRIKQLREVKKLSQKEFGEKIGVTAAAISRIENGERGVTEQMARAICREFNINEEWLRTGKGDMFIQLTRKEEIAEFVGDMLSKESDNFKLRFIEVLSQLDESQWELLEQIANGLAKKEENK